MWWNRCTDAFGYNDAIKNIINNKEDSLSNGFIHPSDFQNYSLDGTIGDLGFTSIIKQSFMNFNDWRNNEELDLVVVFLTGKNGSDEIQVLVEDRIQLTLNETYLTPTLLNLLKVIQLQHQLRLRYMIYHLG